MAELTPEKDKEKTIEELTEKVDSLLETPGEELGIAAAALTDLLCRSENGNKASQFIDIAISNLENTESLEGRIALVETYFHLSVITMNDGNLSDSEKMLNQAWDLAQATEQTKLMCNVLNLRAVVMQRQNKLKEALLTYRKGLRLARDSGDDALEARFLFNTGVVFFSFNSLLDQVEKYNSLAEVIYRRIGDKRGLAYSLNLSSSICEDKGDTVKALEYARESLEIRRELGNTRDQAHSLINIAVLLDPKEEMDEITCCFKEAADLFEKNGYNISYTSAVFKYADVLLKSGRIEEAEARLDQAAALFEGIEGYLEIRIFMYKVQRDLAKSKGNWKIALEVAQKLELLGAEARRKGIAGELNAVCARWDAELVERERTILSGKNRELEILNDKLDQTLVRISKMKELLPTCPSCGRVKDDEGYWQKLDIFFVKHSTVRVSHSLCEDCRRKLYPDLDCKQVKI